MEQQYSRKYEVFYKMVHHFQGKLMAPSICKFPPMEPCGILS